MTSCSGYCTSVTSNRFPGFSLSPILILKLRLRVCFKSYSLISTTETGFTQSTRNTEELGYCFCIWENDSPTSYDKKVQDVTQGWGVNALCKHYNFILTGCYWSAGITGDQRVHFGASTHHSNTGLWVGNRLKRVGLDFTDTKEYGRILWLKVVTPKTGTQREH